MKSLCEVDGKTSVLNYTFQERAMEGTKLKKQFPSFLLKIFFLKKNEISFKYHFRIRFNCI